jgi:hypothetical protein
MEQYYAASSQSPDYFGDAALPHEDNRLPQQRVTKTQVAT